MHYQFLPLEPIVRASGLSKSFKHFKAVDDLSFSILPGEVYGFLGQNGAGKSTTMRMLLGLIKPDKGEVHIKGKLFNNGSRHLLQYIGAIIERPDMYGYLSGWDNLRMIASLSKPGIKDARLYEVLELVGLKGREKDKVKGYSQGMKQRLGIAIALVHDPELLILDEPTNGLDPQGIAEMRSLIISLSRDHGKTVMVSSHLLYEIEQVATQILIIDKGRKVTEGAAGDLLDPEQTLFDVHVLQGEDLRLKLSLSGWEPYLAEYNRGILTFKMHPAKMPELNKWLVEQGASVLEIRSKHSLEAFFLSLTHDATAHPAGAI